METDRVVTMAEAMAERNRDRGNELASDDTSHEGATVIEVVARQLPEGYEFADWSQVRQSEQVRQMIVSTVKQKAWPLYIHGNPGSGKTCIAALAYEMCGRRPMWSRADDFFWSTLIAVSTAKPCRRRSRARRACFSTTSA